MLRILRAFAWMRWRALMNALERTSARDTLERFSLAVDKQKGVDFKFTSSDLTLRIDKLSERIIKPAMVQLANQIDRDLTALYKNVWN